MQRNIKKLALMASIFILGACSNAPDSSENGGGTSSDGGSTTTPEVLPKMTYNQWVEKTKNGIEISVTNSDGVPTIMQEFYGTLPAHKTRKNNTDKKGYWTNSYPVGVFVGDHYYGYSSLNNNTSTPNITKYMSKNISQNSKISDPSILVFAGKDNMYWESKTNTATNTVDPRFFVATDVTETNGSLIMEYTLVKYDSVRDGVPGKLGNNNMTTYSNPIKDTTKDTPETKITVTVKGENYDQIAITGPEKPQPNLRNKSKQVSIFSQDIKTNINKGF